MEKQVIAVICGERRMFDQFLRENRFERDTEQRKFVHVGKREHAIGIIFSGLYEYGPRFPQSYEVKTEVLRRIEKV